MLLVRQVQGMRPMATDSTLTRSEWPAVYGSRASSAVASARIAPV